ncbi:unnamed protein product [Lactuca virosa]|uniref:Pre-mRNA-splicing factor 3 domain-containing protein n=1 Tax=Lactuca virosa TaxID=75947 RepID=A0AAU9PRG3_9ASTR|nr:unnamed protein product [Lactuca virosa]
MERSSPKHRDKDSSKDYKHRSSKHADDHHISKHNKHSDTYGDDRREPEKSDGGEDGVKRERSSYNRELREKSVDNRWRHNHKRKDRGVECDEDDKRTDGSSTDDVKSGGISLVALSKAKATLLKRKELAEKMKKIPMLNKGADSARDGLKPPSSSRIPPPPPQSATAGGLPQLPEFTAPMFEPVKRAQELAAKICFRQDPEFAPLISMFPGQLAPKLTVQSEPSKALVLRLDAFNREVDENGNVVNIPKVNNLSTIKVNINKEKKDAFQILRRELEVDPDKNPHFDWRMGIDKNKLLRPKRMTFQFVEEGKWTKDAEITKLKSKFGESQAREFKAKQAHLIPDIEWWDVSVLDILKKEKITLYIEHPRPIEPPFKQAPPPPQPLKLTKKERKKLRTQRRLANEKTRQEMIRQGLLEPPKPKIKMSNLMKVLGSEATQHPTRLEMEIRSAAAEREQAHIDRNNARKLTPAERRDKKKRKTFQ